ncbi:MAG: hypothetical protein AAF141_14990 [Pseudomonadota bacterium]
MGHAETNWVDVAVFGQMHRTKMPGEIKQGDVDIRRRDDARGQPLGLPKIGKAVQFIEPFGHTYQPVAAGLTVPGLGFELRKKLKRIRRQLGHVRCCPKRSDNA